MKKGTLLYVNKFNKLDTMEKFFLKKQVTKIDIARYRKNVCILNSYFKAFPQIKYSCEWLAW